MHTETELGKTQGNAQGETLGDALGHLSSTMIRLYQDWARQQGIHYNQLAVLHTLVRCPSCTQKHIGELWSLPKQTISTICKQYVDEGLIALAQADDRREKHLFLTEKGRQFAQPIVQRLDAMEQQAFAEFGLARSEKLLQELSALAAVFGRHMGVTAKQ